MTYGFLPYGAAPYASPPEVSTFAAAPGNRILLLSPVASDAAAIVASSAVATLPAVNLQNVQPTRKWRSQGVEASLNVTFPEDAEDGEISANTLALVGVNFTHHALVRVRAAATAEDLTADPAIDTGLASPWPGGVKPHARNWPQFTVLVFWENEAPLRFWQIDIVDAGGGLTYLEAGRLMLGRAWQPSINIDIGGDFLAYDPRDVVAETDRGFTFTDRRTESPPRLFALNLTAGNRREIFDGLGEIQRLAGLAGDVVCCIDPADSADFHRYVMQGRFTAGPRFSAPALFDESGYTIGASINLREFL